MNILFYLSCTPNPLNGGIERVSSILAQEFIKRGHKCFCIYYLNVEPGYLSPLYEDQQYIPLESKSMLAEVEDFISRNNINVVMNQLAYISPVCDVINTLKNKYNYKLIITHHNNPFPSIARLRTTKYHSYKGNLKKIIAYFKPEILIRRFTKAYIKEVNEYLKYCEYYVLLANAYKSKIQEHIISDKLISIYNPLTYQSFFDMKEYSSKEKIVLFVGRYAENQKRVSKALHIWKLMEKYGYDDWKFVLVGHGPDENLYRKIIQDLNIKNIELLGKNNPLEFYKKASIFVMTSSYEGWSMTLAEAKQNGVVPICFNTFLASTEIINDGVDGFIVEDGHNKEYISKLRTLMNNDDLRRKMAENAVINSKKFSVEKIASQWLSIIENRK